MTTPIITYRRITALLLLCVCCAGAQAATYRLEAGGLIDAQVSSETVKGTWSLTGLVDYDPVNETIAPSTLTLYQNITEIQDDYSPSPVFVDYRYTNTMETTQLFMNNNGPVIDIFGNPFTVIGNFTLTDCASNQANYCDSFSPFDGGFSGMDPQGGLNWSTMLEGTTPGGLGVSGNLTLNEVPLPAAAWLFGSALAGLFGWRQLRPASFPIRQPGKEPGDL